MTITPATKAISGDMVHSCCDFLDILHAILALRQINVNESNHTSNGLKTLKSKYHVFLNICILENLCFGFGYMGNVLSMGEINS